MGIQELTFSMVIIVITGVFLAGFMDAIAGGGGIISLPAYLLTGLPVHYALGTNKMSSCLGTIASTARYLKNGCVNWKLAPFSIVCALLGAQFGTRLQLTVPDVYLKYLLIPVLPAVAFVVLRKRALPEEEREMPFVRRALSVSAAALVIGTYDGFYGPGTGTFLLIVFCRLGGMDVRSASGNVKLTNLASNVSALVTSLLNGKVFLLLGLLASAFSIAGHYLGSGVAIRNGSKIIKPTIIVVLGLLLVKIIVEFFTK